MGLLPSLADGAPEELSSLPPPFSLLCCRDLKKLSRDSEVPLLFVSICRWSITAGASGVFAEDCRGAAGAGGGA